MTDTNKDPLELTDEELEELEEPSMEDEIKYALLDILYFDVANCETDKGKAEVMSVKVLAAQTLMQILVTREKDTIEAQKLELYKEAMKLREEQGGNSYGGFNPN